jgi:hypothetical protein
LGLGLTAVLLGVVWKFWPTAAAAPRPAPRGRSVSVGPKGNFGTLGAALEYLRGIPANPQDPPCSIELAAGTELSEHLEIDGRKWKPLARGVVIRGASGPRPKIRGDTDSAPVLSVAHVDRFVLERCIVESPGASAAMKLAGVLVDSALRDVEVRGFTSTGLEAVGVAGFPGQEFLLEQVDFRGAAERAVGVRWKGTERDRTGDVQLRDCRLLGPLRAGLEFTGPLFVVRLEGCIFHRCEAALQFTQANQNIRGLSLVHSTLHGCDRGLAFAGPPSFDSTTIALRNNLFAAQSGGEVVVEQGDAAATQRLISTEAGELAHNWSDFDSTGAPGAVDIFGQGGRRGIDPIPFRSTDPQAAEFLQPTGSEVRVAAEAVGASEDYVGARPPH